MTDAEKTQNEHLRGDGFIKFTDKLISIVKQRGIIARSSNYFICKPFVEEVTEGGIIKATSVQEFEQRRSGYGRIIACPNNDQVDEHYSDIKPGMFVLYNSSGHFKPHLETVRVILGIKDFPDNFIYIVPDNEILCTVDNSDTGKRI